MEKAPPLVKLSCAEQSKDACTRYGALKEETFRLLPQDCHDKTGTEAAGPEGTAGMTIYYNENHHQARKNSTPTIILILIVISTTFLCVQWVDVHHTVTALANKNAQIQEQIRGSFWGQENFLQRAVADQNQQIQQQIQQQESSQQMQRAEEAERLADLESAVAKKLRAFNASIQASKEVAHPPNIKHPPGTSSCPPGLEIKTIEECAVAGGHVRATFKEFHVRVNHWDDHACGCYVDNDNGNGFIHFNVAISCYTDADSKQTCGLSSFPVGPRVQLTWSCGNVLCIPQARCLCGDRICTQFWLEGERESNMPPHVGSSSGGGIGLLCHLASQV